MNQQEIDKQLAVMTMAGSQAVGLLSAMICHGTIPKVHREQAGAIVAKFDEASASIHAKFDEARAASEATAKVPEAAKEAAPNFCCSHGHLFTGGVCTYCAACYTKAPE